MLGVKGWVLGAALGGVLFAACGKAERTASDDESAGGANPLDLLAGLGAGPPCGECPQAEHVTACCDEYCGYLNEGTSECVPSRAGSQMFTVATGPDAELCRARVDCESDAACPPTLPAEGSRCSGPLDCHYCLQPSLPRTVACRLDQWFTLGPNPVCSYYVEP